MVGRELNEVMHLHNLVLVYKGNSTVADKKRRLAEYLANPEKYAHYRSHRKRPRTKGQPAAHRLDLDATHHDQRGEESEQAVRPVPTWREKGKAKVGDDEREIEANGVDEERSDEEESMDDEVDEYEFFHSEGETEGRTWLFGDEWARRP
jgi:type II secretory pathway component PulK